MPLCGCKLHVYRFRLCRHYGNPIKHECWRADLRTKSPCMGSLFPCGKPVKAKHSRDGLCDSCAAYFAGFGDRSNEVLAEFLEYKESRGWRKKRVNPRQVAPEKFVRPDILLHNSSVRRGGAQPFRPQSPMRATLALLPRNSHLPQPPPPVRQTQSGERRAERRARTPFEHALPGDCAASQSSSLILGDRLLMPNQGVYTLPRGHSTEPCPLARRITEEAERLFPNPESAMYPGVPKLSAAPKKHRRNHPRLPRGNDNKAPELTVVPAVIVSGGKAFKHRADAATAATRSPSEPLPAPTPSRFFVLASPDAMSPTGCSAHVRSLSLDQTVAMPPPQRLEGVLAASCPQHGERYDFGCGECRGGLFRERGLPTEEHRERYRSMTPVSVAAAETSNNRLGHCRSTPLVVSVTTPQKKFTCAAQGLCTCRPVEGHVCLPCHEKETFSEQIEGGWI
ncbi:hypothetical protein DL762_007805 [Monosporascus cannonballus]|uniref:Copper-fist domain-containing protein n=1 Tax=Monosporascus cannonballus TaxID=155416 RepID=A0ABY0GZ40_9PEZI|nr:hypothetical protein DL762_007805 [Monosporascus cannonballus]RYO99024.1 hypothetical protein DL763_001829 [Monosporascus cannonballus]